MFETVCRPEGNAKEDLISQWEKFQNGREKSIRCDNLGTEWILNVEKAPWWGGVFERLVKSTKRCLRKFIGRAKFSLDDLHTGVVEVESIVISRPLTYLSASDLEEPLTTPHVITGKCVINLLDDLSYRADLDDGDFTVSQEQVRKRVKYIIFLNHSWD